MKKIKLKGGVTLSVPESYSELTMRMFVKIQKSGVDDEANFLSAICGISREEFVKLKDTNVDVKIYNEIGWFAEQTKFDELKHPSYLMVNNKKIKIPKDIGYETYEQKLAVTNHLSDKLVDSEVMAYMIAVYLYPKYYEDDFNGDDVENFMELHILDLRFVDLYPIGTFFLQSLREFLNSKIAFYQKNTNRTNSEQVLKNSKSLRNLKR